MVLDFAAEGDLYVYSCVDTSLKAEIFPYKIPYDYDLRFKSNADPDQDGFTNWEEYRGFVDDSWSHFRLDPLQSDVFVYDYTMTNRITQTHYDRASQVAGAMFTLVGCPTETGYFSAYPRILDFVANTHYLSPWFEVTETPNPLCYPGYNANVISPRGGHQGYIYVFDGYGPGGGELGICSHDPNYPVPGGVGTSSIVIWTSYIDEIVPNFQGLPNENHSTVEQLLYQRALNHELGHAFGLPHTLVDDPANGDFRCVMSYILVNSASMYNCVPTTWESYQGQIGWGYWIESVGNQDTYDFCNGEVQFRP